MIDFQVTLSTDKRRIVIALPPGQNAMSLTANEFEDLLGKFGELRTHMLPAVPLNPPANAKVRAVEGTYFGVGTDLFQNKPVLHARDPRFGWLHYVLPMDTVLKLTAALEAGSRDATTRQTNEQKSRTSH